MLIFERIWLKYMLTCSSVTYKAEEITQFWQLAHCFNFLSNHQKNWRLDKNWWLENRYTKIFVLYFNFLSHHFQLSSIPIYKKYYIHNFVPHPWSSIWHPQVQGARDPLAGQVQSHSLWMPAPLVYSWRSCQGECDATTEIGWFIQISKCNYFNALGIQLH